MTAFIGAALGAGIGNAIAHAIIERDRRNGFGAAWQAIIAALGIAGLLALVAR